MSNEADFLKYLDKELNRKETEEVEKLIRSSPEQKAIFDELAKKKQQTLESLNSLNPEEPVNIPDFKPPVQLNNKWTLKSGFLSLNIWRYAAAIAILLGLALSYMLFTPEKSGINEVKTTAINNVETTQDEFEDLNYYISPNRNWNKRELVWTVLEKKK